MIKAVVFDLDGTLCGIGEAISAENLKLLKKLQEKQIKIIISSGKPTYYLCGFFRQAGLKDVIMIGENGACVQFGIDLPPVDFEIMPYSVIAKNNIEFFKNEILKVLPNIFFQPNLVGVGVFPKNKLEYQKIRKIVEDNSNRIQGIDIYFHSDAVDFAPKEINKFDSLKCLCEKMNINSDEIIAVGDGENDYPMFKFAKNSYGVNIKDETKVTQNFKKVDDVLNKILTLVS